MYLVVKKKLFSHEDLFFCSRYPDKKNRKVEMGTKNVREIDIVIGMDTIDRKTEIREGGRDKGRVLREEEMIRGRDLRWGNSKGKTWLAHKYRI